MLPPLAFTHSHISELRIQDCEFMDIRLQGARNHLAWCPHAALSTASDSHGVLGQKDGLILRFQI